MALIVKDRVKQSAAAPGTGTVTLGSTPTGFQSFAAVGNANTTYFAIVDPISGDWEVNYGVYTSSGTTLTRNATPLSSSNSGSLVNFTGAVDVFVTYPSEKAVYEDTAGVVTFTDNPILSAGTANGVTYLNGSKVLTSGSALTFDGVTFSTTLKIASTGSSTSATYFQRSIAPATESGIETAIVTTGNADNQRAGLFASNNYASNLTTELIFKTNASTGSASEGLRLTSTSLYTASGINVGIGNSSPNARLDVRGDMGSSPSAVVRIRGTNTTARTTRLQFEDYSGALADGLIDFKIPTSGDVTSAKFQLGINGPAITMDVNGNVGIGTTSPNNNLEVLSSSNPSIAVTSTSASLYCYYGMTAGTVGGTLFTFGQSYSAVYPAGSTALANNTYGVILNASNATGILRFQTNDTERMRITSAGDVGIGTSSPSARLHAVTTTAPISIMQTSNANGGYIEFNNGSTSPLYVGFGATLVTGISTSDAALRYSNNLIFSSGATEVARFIAGGQLCIGKTTTGFGTTGIYFNSSGQGLYTTTTYEDAGGGAIYLNRLGVDGTIQLFYKDTNNVGNIAVTASATAYNTSSDYRLKNSIAPMTGSLAKIAQLKPVTYKWNADGSDGEGFIAHELAEVCPQAVTGAKDALDKDGKPVYQGIDVSFLVATLTAAIQEQQAIIESLKARLDTANL